MASGAGLLLNHSTPRHVYISGVMPITLYSTPLLNCSWFFTCGTQRPPFFYGFLTRCTQRPSPFFFSGFLTRFTQRLFLAAFTCRRSNSAQAGEPRAIEAQNSHKLPGGCRQCQPPSNGTSSGCDSGTEIHTYPHTYSHNNHVSLCHAKAHTPELQTGHGEVFSGTAEAAGHTDLSPAFEDDACSPAPSGTRGLVLVDWFVWQWLCFALWKTHPEEKRGGGCLVVDGIHGVRKLGEGRKRGEEFIRPDTLAATVL